MKDHAVILGIVAIFAIVIIVFLTVQPLSQSSNTAGAAIDVVDKCQIEAADAWAECSYGSTYLQMRNCYAPAYHRCMAVNG